MLPAALLQEVPAQILLVTALHYDDLGAGLGIIHARGHYHIPPVKRRLPHCIGMNLVHFMGIVTNNAIAAFARYRAADGVRQPVS